MTGSVLRAFLFLCDYPLGFQVDAGPLLQFRFPTNMQHKHQVYRNVKIVMSNKKEGQRKNTCSGTSATLTKVGF